MSKIVAFFKAARKLGRRVGRSVPADTVSTMAQDLVEMLVLEKEARAEHEALVSESKKAFRELRSLEWIVLHSGDYRIPGVIALPLKIYNEESGEEDTHDTYYAAATALGMEKEHVSW